MNFYMIRLKELKNHCLKIKKILFTHFDLIFYIPIYPDEFLFKAQ
jgi:hypothetical protein